MLGSFFALALQVHSTNIDPFINDYTETEQLGIIILSAILFEVPLGYVGFFWTYWVFDNAAWTWEVSYGFGALTGFFFASYLLPSLIASMERHLAGSVGVINRSAEDGVEENVTAAEEALDQVASSQDHNEDHNDDNDVQNAEPPPLPVSDTAAADEATRPTGMPLQNS